MSFIDALLGNTSAGKLKRIRPIVDKINAFEPEMVRKSDDELRNKTDEFRERLANGSTLDELLPEAFAVVREAAKRTVGMRPFDVQMIGGIILHQGRIAEMKTGEGKTLVSVMPAYLNALTGKGVFVITANDYLAARDANWMGKIHRFLGLTVGCVTTNAHPMPDDGIKRQAAYQCDVIYGYHSEIGFDYLRDNLAVNRASLLQRDYYYAIVDEVDSILIDEAKTPLIISGKGDIEGTSCETADKVVRGLEFGGTMEELTRSESGFDAKANRLMQAMSKKSDADSPEDDSETADESAEKGDYMVDYKTHSVILTARGIKRVERAYSIENLYDAENNEINHYIQNALKAHALYNVDKEYVVEDGQVLLVDEFTGRTMYGRRLSDGLHQAIEAKEHYNDRRIQVRSNDQTIASITYQNLFRLFPKLAGMTGTAKTEEDEFQDIYDLDVVEIPTNAPCARQDLEDYLYLSMDEKFDGILDEVRRIHETGQPILIGTASVTMSEQFDKLLSKNGIPHEVLNAKNHRREAQIIAQAGQLDAVTIATNMAGRGTDILLGGNPDFMARRDMKNEDIPDDIIEEATSRADTDNEEVLAARERYNELYKAYKVRTDAEHDKVVAVGGLYILGTEHHESRRIDNQLRGRSGRQGDIGTTRFFVSLEDDIMVNASASRIESVTNMCRSMGLSGAINAELGKTKIISKLMDTTQKRVEAINYDMRKRVLEYDDVMNQMRETVYAQRKSVLMGEDIHDTVLGMIRDVIENQVGCYCNPSVKKDAWEPNELASELKRILGFVPECLENIETEKHLADSIYAEALARYNEIDAELEQFSAEHAMQLAPMAIRERVYLLRTVDRYWALHLDAMDELRNGIGLRAFAQTDPIVAYRRESSVMFDNMIAGIREDVVITIFRTTTKTNVNYNKPRRTLSKSELIAIAQARNAYKKGTKPQTVLADKTVGRNDPCPCGSGKKNKNCCGRNQ